MKKVPPIYFGGTFFVILFVAFLSVGHPELDSGSVETLCRLVKDFSY
jgi:hypothetical protein